MSRSERIELRPGTHESRAVKDRPHRTPDDLGIPEVNGPRHGEDGGRVERGGGAEDGADVSGILNRVEHDEACADGELESVEETVGNLGDREDALRGIGFGRTAE